MPRLPLAAPLLALLVSLQMSCDRAPQTRLWAASPTEAAPRWLSESGIYADIERRTPGAGFVEYAPAFPMWTNGAGAQRMLRLPPGAVIDNSEPALWRLPPGSVLAKTFTYPAVEGRAGDVAVETRVLARGPRRWVFATYQWNAEGTEARLMGADWDARAVDLARAGGGLVRHTIPSRRECASCHETRAETPVLGVDPLNASEEMARALPFQSPVEGTSVARLPGRTPEESAVMGYLVGNCAHCHNGQNHGGELGGMNATFSLRPEDLVESTVRQRTNSSASGAGIRVSPRRPSQSALFQATVVAPRQARPRYLKMPPLGVDTPDPALERLLRAWIMKL